MAHQFLNQPFSPSLNKSRRSSLPHKFPTAEREALYHCNSRKDGEIRPSVVIHYMPHRTFETPILCTCVPAMEIPLESKIPNPVTTTAPEPDNHVSVFRSKSNAHLSTLKPTLMKRELRMSKSTSNLVNDNKNRVVNPNKNRVRIQQPTKAKSHEESTFYIVNLTTQSERPFLRSSTRPDRPADHVTSNWNLNMTRRKSASLKRFMMKPYKKLKRKLMKKTLHIESSPEKKEPYCRFTTVSEDFNTVTI